MKKCLFTILMLTAALTRPFAQDAVRQTVSGFPYDRLSDARSALETMQGWGRSDWKGFFSLFNDTLTAVKAEYAVDAYVHAYTKSPAQRRRNAAVLSQGLTEVKGFVARDLLIRLSGANGDDASVPALGALLNESAYVGAAARALATIGSGKALSTLEKAAAGAQGLMRTEIDMAREHAARNAESTTAAPMAAPTHRLAKQEEKAGFEMLFDGTGLGKWIGNKKAYVVENGEIVVKPSGGGSGGNLYTAEQYGDFELRFEFQLTPGANNGLGIRTPAFGDAAYVGMELQILDNEAEKYKNLKPYQYHGSIYGVSPSKRGHLKPTGEWNRQTVIAQGPRIKVVLNGTVILDTDISDAVRNGTPDGNRHPGLGNASGHIGFLGHGDVLRFRNIRIKRL